MDTKAKKVRKIEIKTRRLVIISFRGIPHLLQEIGMTDNTNNMEMIFVLLVGT
jgi:hypothetical protein